MGAGDIALTVARSAPNLKFTGFSYYPGTNGANERAVVTFVDDLGTTFTTTIVNGACIGFDASTGAVTNINSASELTTLKGNVFKAGALSTEVAQLKTAGIIVAPGTVG